MAYLVTYLITLAVGIAAVLLLPVSGLLSLLCLGGDLWFIHRRAYNAGASREYPRSQ